ncbi:hypothetical protein Tco_0487046 [Tanacetum coccineum]
MTTSKLSSLIGIRSILKGEKFVDSSVMLQTVGGDAGMIVCGLTGGGLVVHSVVLYVCCWCDIGGEAWRRRSEFLMYLGWTGLGKDWGDVRVVFVVELERLGGGDLNGRCVQIFGVGLGYNILGDGDGLWVGRVTERFLNLEKLSPVYGRIYAKLYQTLEGISILAQPSDLTERLLQSSVKPRTTRSAKAVGNLVTHDWAFASGVAGVNNNIHRRPDSAVHHTGDDYVLGNLKFVPKGESVEVFGMAIPDPLITEAIRQSSTLSHKKMKLNKERFYQRDDDDPDLVLAKKLSMETLKKGRRKECETETIAPKGDKDQGEIDSSTITSGVSIPVSDPEKAHEALRSIFYSPSLLVTPPPINTEATTITTSLPEITPFIALVIESQKLEQECSESEED